MARSGISAAELLASVGADVTIQDIKPLDALEKIHDLDEMRNKGIKIYAGANPDDIIGQFDYAVMSPGVPCDLPFVKKAEELNVNVISEVELAYTLTKCPVCAITGTNGKTTTTTLAGLLLERKYKNTAVVGNIGVAYSEKALSLTKNDYVCAEISSFQLETSHTFRPHIAAVLNITPDHLNRHKTMENYVAVKEKIFANQGKDDFTILNKNDPYCIRMGDKTDGRVFFFSSGEKLDEGIYLDGDEIHIKWDGLDEDVINVNELKILGVHNYENVMAAVACAVCAGVEMDEIRDVLREFNGVEHRIEYCGSVDGVKYYNDSKATNVDAAVTAIEAIGKDIILIAGGDGKGQDFTDLIKNFRGRVKHLILLGRDGPLIGAAADKEGYGDHESCPNMEECVKRAAQMADSGDTVLLSPACASWDMYDNFEQRGRHFKEIVARLSK